MLHYYGDWVRRLFFFGGLLMLATLPLFKDLVPMPILAAPFVVVALTLIAAFTNPESKTGSWLNVLVSAVAIIFFEYYAIQTMLIPSWDEKMTYYFWTNHVLALNFAFALYYSTKTLRGMVL